MRYIVGCLLFAGMYLSIAAYADVLPIESGSEAEKVAGIANSIWGVQVLTLKNLKYKIVSLDSSLNGDLNATTMILVGESVGGEAGYEAAFQITPDKNYPDVLGLNSARVNKHCIEVVLSRLDGEPITKCFFYERQTKTLREVSNSKGNPESP